jgi:putative transposase
MIIANRYYCVMPRQARLDVPGALHHIMVRGINKSDIFLDDQDRQRFLERLGVIITDAKSSVLAWSLMSNHVHILFKSGEGGISSVMRKLLTWYAIYFNHKYKRTGHLFENRYKSILCEEDQYLFALIRYIHLNPVRSGIIKTLDELDNYPWTGHSIIMGRNAQSWMDTGYCLSQFDKQIKRARISYRVFIEDGLSQGHLPTFSGGGLLNSQGGWSAVISMKRRNEIPAHDERILGSDNFINRILEEAGEKEQRQFKAKRFGRTITDIIAETAEQLRISEQALRSGNRRRKVSEARLLVAVKCSEELGMTAADIARCLGVTTSAIVKVLNKVNNRA